MSIDNKINAEGIIEKFYYKKEGLSFYAQKSQIKKKIYREKHYKSFEIEQGDILINFPDDFYISEYLRPLALIIGTYSCDIPKVETTMMHFLPIYPFEGLNIVLLGRYIETNIESKRRDDFADFDLKKIENFPYLL
ncbi:hypothetical protein ES705_43397 [subsurface metagenome]